MNLVLIIGLVIRDQPLLYIVGSLIFVALVLVIFGQATHLLPVPDSIVSTNIE
jgi:hypothetical protein